LIGEDVRIQVLLHSDEGCIKADPGHIEQIIMNLSVNARDAMRSGGSIFLETDIIYLDEDYCKSHAEVSPGSYVVLTVTDTGEGVAPEIMDKIFEPFFTTKAVGEGTGLGLSTVYGIVKQHKGHIFVYSEVGSGTTFKMCFPRVDEVADIEISESVGDMKHGTETVLVVDDEVTIRKLVIDTLAPLGYNVLEADGGQEALQIFKTTDKEIDLLLTDVVMPKMSGRELAEKVEADWPDVKVLFMSGYTDNVIVHQGVLKPGVFFINKPLLQR
jgi:CheY-like chemotaxis protein